MKNNFVNNLLITIVGGLGLFFSTIILQAFISSPPSRAEFDAHKADVSRHLKNIDDKLSIIREKQDKIFNHLLEGR